MKKRLLTTLVSLTFLITPILILAQAPTLGTAANFVLFTSVGAVTNSGISQITGNVGTNSGSTTGFGNVNGQMHDNNGVTAQATADLLIAYNQLNNLVPNFFPAPLLGNGDTLVAGVYKINAVTTLSGRLTLNAQGNPNAVFVFQIEAAFSSNPAAKIRLINGAQSCNVFWKIEGRVSIATGTFFRGNIVANNAAIALTTNDTLEGRALSTRGAVTCDGILAYIPSGCGSVPLTGPAAPALGSANCFAILSGNGAVTNAGISYVNGDIGSNVGLTSGYDPLNVNGTIHTNPDNSTSMAAADLLVAYNYLNVLPTDIQLLYPAQFGNNLVLTPHTYLMNAAVSFNGIVFLNAQGNTNAVFVIKINGALTTSTFSRVVLTNGAQAKNVYWKVDGAVSINDYSIFNGTIIANNGALNLATGVTLTGKAFTTNGAISTAAITTNQPPVCTALPVTWLYFRGNVQQKNVLLEWATTNEVNNGFFTIEKSMDGIRFVTFTTVNATQQTGSGEHRYAVTDMQPFSSGYYRISQTDKDGRRNYYTTIQVKLNTNQGMLVQQYVHQDYINVQISGAQAATGSATLYSMDGKRITSQKILLANGPTNYKMEKPTQSGIYVLYIESEGKRLYTGKVMIQY